MVYALFLFAISLSQGQPVVDGVRSHGELQLSTYQAVDLDLPQGWRTVCVDDCGISGPPGESFKGSNLQFRVIGKKAWLLRQHGTLFAMNLSSGEGLAHCEAGSYSKHNIEVGNLPVDTLICVITSDRRYAELRIGGYDQGKKILSAIFTTWEKTVAPTKKK
jgi:hypothetical protein